MPRLRLAAILALITLLGGAACGASVDITSSTPTPKVGVVQQPSRVMRQTARVWAGESGASPLPQLNDNLWHSFPARSLVTTDASGEAAVDISGCMLIYVFQNSQLLKAACPKSDYSGGNATCSIAGTSVFNNTCSTEVVIQTPSADLTLEGTYLSVTYNRAAQTTTVLVFSGAVKARPILDADTGKRGEPVTINKNNFWFTTTDANLPALQGSGVRKVLPIKELAPLNGILDVDPWLDEIKERSETDKVSLPDLSPVRPESQNLALLMGGGPLRNDRVQEAVLMAVPWAELAKATFPRQTVSIKTELRNERIDALAVKYDIESAYALLHQANLSDGFEVILFYAKTDDRLSVLAKRMVEPLDRVGIRAELAPVAPADALPHIQDLVRSGRAVLYLGGQ
jgi:hypothetical protein